MSAVAIRPAVTPPAARWDRADYLLSLELDGPAGATGAFVWPVLDRVEADALEGERALAYEVLQAERPGYGFNVASCFSHPVIRFSEVLR